MASGLFKHFASHLALKTESISVRPRTEYFTPNKVYQKRTLVTTEFAKIFENAMKFACLLNFILYGRTSSHRLLHFWLNGKKQFNTSTTTATVTSTIFFENHFSRRLLVSYWRQILGRNALLGIQMVKRI